MSVEKRLAEARRWYTTALDDLKAARILRDNDSFAFACFHAQQAAEKGVKAVYYAKGEDPWGHSLVKLLSELGNLDSELLSSIESLADDARSLDRYYIPTRYPNGLPDIIPSQAFGKPDAERAISAAQRVLTTCEKHMEM